MLYIIDSDLAQVFDRFGNEFYGFFTVPAQKNETFLISDFYKKAGILIKTEKENLIKC